MSHGIYGYRQGCRCGRCRAAMKDAGIRSKQRERESGATYCAECGVTYSGVTSLRRHRARKHQEGT